MAAGAAKTVSFDVVTILAPMARLGAVALVRGRHDVGYQTLMNALDTHGLVKRLIAAGFQEAQAEAVTDVVLESRPRVRSVEFGHEV